MERRVVMDGAPVARSKVQILPPTCVFDTAVLQQLTQLV